MKFCNNRTAMLSLNSMFLNLENKKLILEHLENISDLEVEKHYSLKVCAQ